MMRMIDLIRSFLESKNFKEPLLRSLEEIIQKRKDDEEKKQTGKQERKQKGTGEKEKG